MLKNALDLILHPNVFDYVLYKGALFIGWHRKGQTHEMMTPYALYGLLEAEKAGYTIPDEDAIRQGLHRLRQFIDSMGEKQAADRIYCTYVYAHRHDVPEPVSAWMSLPTSSSR